MVDREQIAAAGLAGVRSDGTGGLMALCPCHEDHDPSLHLWEDEGRLAFACLAGCEWVDLRETLSGLGLPVADVANDSRPVIEATHDYRDEAGKLVYQVVRYRPKGFRQRRPGGSSGWVWNMKDTPRLPFRLPELLEGVAAGQTIYVTEGEKDALAIVDAGGVATCNSGGAGKWRAEYAVHFVGADVLIVADKDEPGRRHAAQVAESLRSVAASVAIVEARRG